MIGYYVHHQGRGHLHRATAVAQAVTRRTGEPVTGLSTLPRPDSWTGPWEQLPPDDEDGSPEDVTAGGRLHWVPLRDPGVGSRASALSRWIEGHRPRLVVVDVSVEVAVLVRLHGVPVVSVVLPGRRTDPAHLLGFGVSSQLVACWPAAAHGMSPGLPDDLARRVHHVGAVSRFPVVRRGERRPGPRRVVLLQGRGGGRLTTRTGARLRDLAPDWEWTSVGADGWVEDPSAVLRDADVVVTNAGQNSIAEIAACRTPAVVVPADRPHEEQATTASVLAGPDWPALVLPAFPEDGWPGLLDRAAALDGRRWEGWCDGGAAVRLAALLDGPATARRSA